MRVPVAPTLLLLVVAVACSSGGSGDKTGSTAGDGAASKFSLPFIPDDYPAGLAQARERDLPIFVETWAPW